VSERGRVSIETDVVFGAGGRDVVLEVVEIDGRRIKKVRITSVASAPLDDLEPGED